MIKLTFDTNILRDYLESDRPHHSDAVSLVRLDEQGLCEIRVISRYITDVPAGDLRNRLDALAICQRPRIGTIAQWNVSEWNADFWATEKESRIYAELFKLIFPAAVRSSRHHKNRSADVGHLLGHIRAKRDIFVTRDGDILKRKSDLMSNFGVSVMMPADAIKACRLK